jgi:DNA-binding NtrC family response regulator
VLKRVQAHTRLHRLTRELVQKNLALEEEVARRQKLTGQLSMISAREAEHWGLEGFVGQSPTIQQIFKDIRLMQENAATSVLITGESGTGKELIARGVHFGSARRDGEVRRIGEQQARRVKVRVLAATNIDLPRRIREGAFRQDLYFRLARFTVTAPPLRQRRNDIPLLATHFLHLFAAEMGREPPELNDIVLAQLRAYNFPGNVRELKNVIERALLESGGGQIQSHHLHFLPEPGEATSPLAVAPLPELPMNLDQAAAQAQLWVFKRAMAKTGDNISAATRLLGTNRNRAYRLLEQDRADNGQ